MEEQGVGDSDEQDVERCGGDYGGAAEGEASGCDGGKDDCYQQVGEDGEVPEERPEGWQD